MGLKNLAVYQNHQLIGWIIIAPPSEELCEISWLPREQSSCGQHGAHLGPVGPRLAPRWPHKPCYQGYAFPRGSCRLVNVTVRVGYTFTSNRGGSDVHHLNAHYSDVIMGATASQNTSLTIVYSTVYSDADKKIKAPRHWSLCGEFTGDRWIHRTNGQ